MVVPKNTPQQTLAQIQRIVKNTVGFDEQRGDRISVEALIATPVSSVPTEYPHQAQAVSSWPDTQLILYCVAFILFSSTTGLLFLRHHRTQKRKSLLIELTQWLEHHE